MNNNFKSIQGVKVFKRGTKGEVRVWYSDWEPPKNRYRFFSGIVGGALTASGWRSTQIMNVGKSNETTIPEQIELEIKAAYTKKHKAGYWFNVEDIDKVLFHKPMLAHNYEKKGDKLHRDNPGFVYVQPKLDGIRCIADKDGLKFRSGRKITSCPHISDALVYFFKRYPTVVLDGELYNHELKDKFNEIISCVRKATPKYHDAKKIATRIQYHIYDNFDLDSPKNTFEERTNWLHSAKVASLLFPSTNFANLRGAIRIVDTQPVFSKEESDEWYSWYVQEGYEGMMYRAPHSVYKHGRSNDLLKRKDFDTAEFPIVSVEEGNGNWAGFAKRMVILQENGETCGAGIRGDRKEMKRLLEDSRTLDWKKSGYAWATVRYFGKTEDGSLRFPVVIDYSLTEERYS